MATVDLTDVTINTQTGQEYYAGSVDHIKQLCRVLKIGDGRLSQITSDMVIFYMNMIEENMNSYLEEYYFVPIRPYSVFMPDNTKRSIFPGQVRRIAQIWTAGQLLTSEFQDLEPNANEGARNYIDEAKKEIFQLTTFSHRIPGQVYRSGMSRTMPPTMQPSKTPIEQW